MRHRVYLALGSNMGDREKNLSEAIKKVSSIAQVSIEKLSGIYETDPVGYAEQNRFLNMVVGITTSMEPAVLLEELQRIELELKRTREIHWGPRTIDIDILLYDRAEITLPQLTVPHPRMFQRAFVLIPLRDVYPDEEILNKNIDEFINKCEDKSGVRLYRMIVDG